MIIKQERNRWLFICGLCVLISVFFSSLKVVRAVEALSMQEVQGDLAEELRQRLQVPEEWTGFSLYDAGDEYELRWFDEQAEGHYAARVSNLGDLVSINIYNPERARDTRLRFSQLSGQEAIDRGWQYIEQYMPEQIPHLQREAAYIYNTSLASNSIFAIYPYCLNGIAFHEVYAAVFIDSQSGELSSLQAAPSYTFRTIEKMSEQVLSVEEAKEVLRQDIGLELRYRLEQNSYTVTSTPAKVLLEYAWASTIGYIGAIDGKAVQRSSIYDLQEGSIDRSMEDTYDHANEVKDALPRRSLASEAEALEYLKSLPYISIDEKYQLARSQYGDLYSEKDAELLSLTLNEGGVENWTPHFINAQFDSASGELISYYRADASDIDDSDYTPQQIEKTTEAAIDFMRRVQSSIWPELRLVECYPSSERSYNQLKGLFFRFSRVVDGIVFGNDRVDLIFDPVDMQVLQLQRYWTEGVQFPPAEDAISFEAAYRTLWETEALKLYYFAEPVSVDNPLLCDVRLGYMTSSRYTLRIDAFSGEPVFATTYSDEEEPELRYDDLEEHPQRERILAVAQYLPMETSGLFRPQDNIVQIEWLRWLHSLGFGVSVAQMISPGGAEQNDDSLYLNLINSGYLSAAEKEPEEKLTYLGACRYAVQLSGLKRYTKLKGVFSNPYKLSEVDAAYLGLAYGLPLIEWEDVQLQAPLSRAEAALMLHRFLSR